jgi:lysine-specific demethylase 8
MTSLSFEPVRRVPRPSREDFAALARSGEPLVLEGAVAHWPAIGRWTPESLRDRIGDARMQTYVVENRSVVLDPKEGFRIEEMRVADYVARALAGGAPTHYLRAPLEVFPAELRAEIGIPEYCAGALYLRRNVWFSAPDTVSRLHFDLLHNLIAQLHGEKEFLFFPFRERSNLYPHSLGSAMPQFSRVDLENPDFRAFPRLAAARGARCVLREGDLLYLPSRVWHHARSIGPSITVNFWWPPLSMLPFTLLSDVYKRARGLRV